MKNAILKLLMFGVLFAGFMSLVFADPMGTTITSNITDTGRTISPANRTDPGGTITTMVLNAIQQDQQWKAYVGNITGSLTLDDSSGYTIYSWSLSASEISGEIFASRSSSLTWSNVNCSSLATVQTEQSALNINDTVTDSIKNTFNFTVHPSMIVAGRTISADSCNATSTFVNDARQVQATADFPEILLHDNTNLIYATRINQDNVGYNGSNTYDFQMIVADNPTVTSTTYYFYAEIGS
ncbi:MAG: hypothetical protein ACP5N2_06185 [Candidatus Nanoarchaeia archaeon]